MKSAHFAAKVGKNPTFWLRSVQISFCQVAKGIFAKVNDTNAR